MGMGKRVGEIQGELLVEFLVSITLHLARGLAPQRGLPVDGFIFIVMYTGYWMKSEWRLITWRRRVSSRNSRASSFRVMRTSVPRR
jgi:hypothetical protein